MLFEAREIREIVDRLLHAQAVYRPTDLLVELGRLDGADCGRWRSRSDFELADRLYGDPVVIGRELGIASDHARRLGLIAQPEANATREGEPPGLRTGWATTHWVRATVPQMDLFFDNRSTGRAHELIDALLAGNRALAEAALDELERSDPENPLVAAAPQLIASLDLDFSQPDAVWADLEKASALAETALDDRAEDFIGPRWEAMARALEAQPDAAHHASAAWARVGDWDAVVRCLGDDPSVVSGPEQLIRATAAHARLGNRRSALTWLFELCWRFPETGEEIEKLADHTLNLEAALDRWDDLELSREWGWQEFPSWLLLGGYVPNERWQATPSASAAFTALQEALRAPSDIDCRQALKAAHGGVFEQFIARRSRDT